MSSFPRPPEKGSLSISVVVPAHNEAAFLGPCLEAVTAAAANVDCPVEAVVVLNRCTDATREVAERNGARWVEDESRCLAQIRNRGVAAAAGSVIVTCDADSRLHPATLRRVLEELERGAVGGGVTLRFDRSSLGIRATLLFFNTMVWVTGVSCAAFWTTKEAFDAVGGFDESRPMGEDLDFGQRLKRWGKSRGMPYRTLGDAPVLSSARKFDRFGDWSFLRMMLVDAGRIRRSLKGRDTEFVDEYFYDFNDGDRAE